MKNLNFITLLIAITTTSACASQTDVVSEQSSTLNSPNTNIIAHAPAATLDNSYLSRIFNGTQYIAGFSIDKNGINTPIISIEGNDGKSRFYYPNEIVTDFFNYNNSTMAALLSGKTLLLENNQWISSGLKLPPNATVIYSEKDNIVTCSPLSPIKSSDNRGSCSSVKPDWQTEIPWRTVTPKVCNDNIYAKIEPPNKLEYWEISIVDGTILSRKEHAAATVCLEK